MRYWIPVALTDEDLSELVEGDHDLPYPLWERLSLALGYARQQLAVYERDRWNQEMEGLFHEDPLIPDDPADPR